MWDEPKQSTVLGSCGLHLERKTRLKERRGGGLSLHLISPSSTTTHLVLPLLHPRLPSFTSRPSPFPDSPPPDSPPRSPSITYSSRPLPLSLHPSPFPLPVLRTDPLFLQTTTSRLSPLTTVHTRCTFSVYRRAKML